jgi:hypothetical protein
LEPRALLAANGIGAGSQADILNDAGAGAGSTAASAAVGSGVGIALNNGALGFTTVDPSDVFRQISVVSGTLLDPSNPLAQLLIAAGGSPDAYSLIGQTNAEVRLSPDANSGVGQMTITNGYNTPGIGSFATPTTGSRAGGTGGPTGLAQPESPPTENTGSLDFDLPERKSRIADHKLWLVDAGHADEVFRLVGRDQLDLTGQHEPPLALSAR